MKHVVGLLIGVCFGTSLWVITYGCWYLGWPMTVSTVLSCYIGFSTGATLKLLWSLDQKEVEDAE